MTAESSATAGGDAWRRRVLTSAKLAVGLVLLWWVLSQVEWTTLRDNLVGLEAWMLLGIALATALEFVTRFGSWKALLRPVAPRSFATVARVDLGIKFVNHVVPSKAAGHAVAPLVLRHFADLEWSDAVGVAGSNTALYSGLYGVASLAGLAIFALELPAWLAIAIAISTGLYLLAAATIALTAFGAGGRVGGILLSLVRRLPIGRSLANRAAEALPSVVGPARATFRRVVQTPSTVALFALAWAGTLLVGPGIRVGLLLAGFGASFDPWILLPLALVTAYGVTVLPITPGGIGVAEASAVAVFVALGVPEAAIVPAILVDRFLGVYLPAILGWLPMVTVDLSDLLADSVGEDGQ